jgi:hypothetical protein
VLPNIFLQGTPHQLFPVLMAGQPLHRQLFLVLMAGQPLHHQLFPVLMAGQPLHHQPSLVLMAGRPLHHQPALVLMAGAASSPPCSWSRTTHTRPRSGFFSCTREAHIRPRYSFINSTRTRTTYIRPVQFLQQHQDDTYPSKWCRLPPQSVDGTWPPDCVPDFDAPAWNRFSWHARQVFCTPRLVSLASKSGRGPCGGLLINSYYGANLYVQ